MRTFTTKRCAELLYDDDFRSNGNPEVVVVENASGTIKIEATNLEIGNFEAEMALPIESDVIADDIADLLVEHLNLEGHLAAPLEEAP